jgi:hypothetical protein
MVASRFVRDTVQYVNAADTLIERFVSQLLDSSDEAISDLPAAVKAKSPRGVNRTDQSDAARKQGQCGSPRATHLFHPRLCVQTSRVCKPLGYDLDYKNHEQNSENYAAKDDKDLAPTSVYQHGEFSISRATALGKIS